VDAQRREHIARMRTVAIAMAVATASGLVLCVVLGGHPLAQGVGIAAHALTALAYVAGAMYARPDRDVRIDDPVVTGIAVVAGAGATGILYYWGFSSAVVGLVAVVLFAWSIGSAVRQSMLVYLVIALPQSVLGALMAAEAIDDHGLLGSRTLSPGQQVAALAGVQGIYFVAFVLGRVAGRITSTMAAQLERAVRQVSHKEALLEEARQELERVGGGAQSGRFTDQQLGNYVLGEVLGSGAMGEIYQGRHVETGEEVAVKVLRRMHLGDSDIVARFERELKIARTIDVPNVVRVLEVGGVGEAALPFIAMERLRGEDLKAILHREHRMRLDEVVELVRQTAAGLDAAHRLGIVHRDVKPANLYRHESAGKPVWKLLDFGVSKLWGDESLTHGQIVGTPSFMSPEQGTGGRIDHRSDVYSLAVVAYRALTGHPAFSGPDPAATLHAIATRMPPRPSQIVALPPAADAVFAVALAKRPSDRFESAEDFADALARAASDQLADWIDRRASTLLAELPWSAA
jgi:serine/threonine-protein kinase